ncbi:hypothetical protein DNI29_03415 [Hymenobacter sediminis]|uniref:DUF6371 domain-containing protein n=1 Tax=Hymenobacter sediminis TaxID=2218621 RepID=UPI000F4F1EAD|nr:DUF6371 domain-containing protein [Hymenobacter sediminis]RPD49859.1 hypothetical protein DNI29_03415 [Hymenobacter sediminis]
MHHHSAFRFRLQPYAGSRSRTTCPSCGKPRCFTRYIDTETGEILPFEFGRCDHELNCGYFRHPYKEPNYLNGHSGSGARQRQRHSFNTLRPAQEQQISIEASSIPPEIYQASLGHYERNNLAQLLQSRFRVDVGADLCARFRLGTSSYWPGACVFWLIDEQDRVRGGQVVLYDEGGHTVKDPYRHTSWVHTALLKGYQKRHEPVPSWLQLYASQGPKSPCLFGLPQLKTEAPDKPIAIVESAKTAILATAYLPDFVWLATMGLSYLTAERLAPLRHRRIVLFPDAGAFDCWSIKAIELRKAGFDISLFAGLEDMVTPAERQAGLDIGDIFLRDATCTPV